MQAIFCEHYREQIIEGSLPVFFIGVVTNNRRQLVLYGKFKLNTVTIMHAFQCTLNKAKLIISFHVFVFISGDH